MRFLPVLAVSLVSCVSFAPGTIRTMTVPPEVILHNTVRAFEQFRIPVALADERSGRVSSGTFEVGSEWGGEPIENRVTCQTPAGSPDVPLAAITRLNFDVRIGFKEIKDLSNAETDVALRATAERRSETQKFKCRITDEFAQRLLRAIDSYASFYSAGS